MKSKIRVKNIVILAGIALIPILAAFVIPDSRFHILWWTISPGDDASFAVAVLGEPDYTGGIRRRESELKTLEVNYSWRRKWIAYNISFHAGPDSERPNEISEKRWHLISRENY